MSNTTIVAEIACAHNGNKNSLLKLINIAKKSDCDIVQFQFFNSDEISIKGTDDYKINRKLEIGKKHYNEIFKECKKLKIPFWCMVSDIPTAKIINTFNPKMWRIHSSDIHNDELIKYLIKTKKPLSLSTGGSTISEISNW